ncbi:3-oxoadipate enol-lactonase [Amycolatopsis palatopharyngis]|uniref:3-oxoadipate enol-lactonase n=1 Tax=Amycolatopsis palatopharyngis TaxID=187982 RepID=UPI000E21CB90|nr:3-oxoadipate enol-lactonase [Amycolatopsis palatopharyngis]
MTDMRAVFDGPADGPVLVLGPSLGTDFGLFDAQVATLAERYRVLRFNLPGHGGAPAPPGPYSMAGMAGDVLALLDHHGIERCHYAGVSIGGAIGLQLALDAGHRLASLTVCASSARFADPGSWPVRAATVRAEGTAAMLASRAGTWYTHEFARREPAESGRLLDMLRGTAAEGYAGCCEAIATFDVRDRLGEIRVPTLALAGADDPATPPEMLRQIAEGVPHARMVVVPDTAHLLNVEAPGAVNHELAAHLVNASSEAGHG